MINTILLQIAEWAGVIAVTMILALSPAFKRRPLIFQYRQREGLVSLGLFILTWAGMWAAAVYLPQAPVSGTGKDLAFSVDDLARQAGIALLFLAPFGLALLIRRQPLLSVGLGQRTLRASLYLGIALALMTVFLQGKINSIIYGGITTASTNYLLAVLVTAFVEEAIFRGFIQLRLVGWLGETWGWLATTGLFVLWRLPLKLLQVGGVSLPDLALYLGLIFGSGLVLGWVMRKSGNILAPWLYHAFSAWLAVL
jgi:membrane protease YdiL (CAAX protease family)